MNILWITNIPLPESLQLLSGYGELKATGGWMVGAAKALSKNKELCLTIASVTDKVNKLTKLQGESITYYLFPLGKGNLRYNHDYEPYWQIIKEEVNPDVVHIHGTEFSHGLAYVNACGSDKVVVSIQGMKSAYYYYYYGLSTLDIIRNLTFHDVIRGSSIRGKYQFKKQSLYEIELLKKVRHVIGRTSWDRARTWAINSGSEYHFCNETLRDEFYDGSVWSFDNCDKHSIFLSQAGYPLKGLHQVLKAMPLILKHYPDTKIRIAGYDITQCKGLNGLLRISGYGRLIKKMIKQYGLEDKVQFTGNLNALEMKQEYLKCNVFVCPSSIENSPNSLGEAQILGTPCLASYVGGVCDMMKGSESNLYRFEEVEMLAMKVCEVFKSERNEHLQIEVATKRHDPQINSSQLESIYFHIINSTK